MQFYIKKQKYSRKRVPGIIFRVRNKLKNPWSRENKGGVPQKRLMEEMKKVPDPLFD
jgi:hypothetical protein